MSLRAPEEVVAQKVHAILDGDCWHDWQTYDSEAGGVVTKRRCDHDAGFVLQGLYDEGYAVVRSDDLAHVVDWLDGECRLDHHGACQEHTLSTDCPVPRLRAVLNAARDDLDPPSKEHSQGARMRREEAAALISDAGGFMGGAVVLKHWSEFGEAYVRGCVGRLDDAVLREAVAALGWLEDLWGFTPLDRVLGKAMSAWVVVTTVANDEDIEPDGAYGPFDSEQGADEYAASVFGIVLPLSSPKEHS